MVERHMRCLWELNTTLFRRGQEVAVSYLVSKSHLSKRQRRPKRMVDWGLREVWWN